MYSFCKSCGCLLEAKCRSKESHCPEGKWENGFEKTEEDESSGASS